MLKKITIQQLRQGMYIQEFCISWIAHPFWKQSFLVDTEARYHSVKSSNVTELIINTDKGVDVLAEREPKLAPVKHSLEIAKPTPELIHKQAVSMDMELEHASRVVARSKQAVMSMFHEVRMGNAANMESMQPLVEEITDSINRNAGALIGLARLKNKDEYTYMHSIAVCALMIALAKQLNLSSDEIKEAGMAGLLHDIGKMTVPTKILNKPGKLTESEFEMVKQHPLAGYQLLLRAKAISPVALDVCLHHHERFDGTGYPYRYAGDKISLMARMSAVCDVYDAVTSNRPYKKGWCPSESIHKMAEWSGKHFDDQIFQAFVRSIGIYPAGTLVMLETGRMGVVVEQNDVSLLLPMVRVFFSSKSMTYIVPVLLDLSQPGKQDKIVSRELVSKWGFKNIDAYWLGEAGIKQEE
ncbi:HD-GYP domain-containing protein [Solimicrobium silvestre]|uniref:HDIG: uncharacterized domain HDIG n=1 Tax=Solimicrobium silvestre TaxID=2099400 RepID=A0A2S9GYT8_9BURK|nr:HD-GYP domain-containing protein [Solimicrobium silvestre]PRC92871.1 HDIG: uncharacterized domain HDIG [Solimicrobium silvestre]